MVELMISSQNSSNQLGFLSPFDSEIHSFNAVSSSVRMGCLARSSRRPLKPVTRRILSSCLLLRPASDPFDFSTVHPDGGSCHPLRRGRHHIGHQVSNLFRLTETGYARFLWKPLDRLFHGKVVGGRPFLKERLPASGHHGARHHAVDLNSIFYALPSKGLCERDDSRVDRGELQSSTFSFHISLIF